MAREFAATEMLHFMIINRCINCGDSIFSKDVLCPKCKKNKNVKISSEGKEDANDLDSKES